MSDPQLFDSAPYEVHTLPTPEEAEHLGHDARATLRNARLIEAGTNPGTRLPLHVAASRERTGPGPRCGDCAHLYVKRPPSSSGRTFLKCDQTAVRPDVHYDGPDMRAWWPACTRYEPTAGGAA